MRQRRSYPGQRRIENGKEFGMSTPPMILETHAHQPSAWRSPWLWIGIGMAAIAVPIIAIIVAIAFAAQSGAKISANGKPAVGPKVQAWVVLAEDSILVENAGTNTWRGAVITLESGSANATRCTLPISHQTDR